MSTVKKLSAGKAAKFLKVSPRTVMKWVDQGKLKAEREAGTNNRRIAPADLVEFMRFYDFETPAELLAMLPAD